MSSELIQIPDGKAAFQVGGTTFAVDLIEAVQECNRISDACQGTKNFEYLTQLREWVQNAGGPKLSMGQAQALWDAIYVAYARSKKSFTDALALLSSSGSTRSS